MHIGPNIVEDGLVLYLDAANKKSYSGTGTDWYDLSGNGNTGILTNGPTFDSANAGSIVFDKVDDRIDCTVSQVNTTSTNFNTVSMWMFWTGQSNGFPMEFTTYRLWFPQTTQFGFNTGASDCYGFNPIDLANKWTYLVALFYNGSYTNNSKMYINGIEQSLQQLRGTARSGNATSQVTIGGYRSGNQYPFPGKISNFQIYNRALTPQEILQNYNATKGRYL